MIPAHIEHTFKAIDRILNPGPQQPMPGIPALVEGPSPCDDARTAGVVYPVTCAARYYDAASRILEDEPRMFTHGNSNELGAHIQQWIEAKRNNLGPR